MSMSNYDSDKLVRILYIYIYLQMMMKYELLYF